METERARQLANFVSWVGANIKGDEKGEAQVFLDRFFQAFGHAGLEEADARQCHDEEAARRSARNHAACRR